MYVEKLKLLLQAVKNRRGLVEKDYFQLKVKENLV